MIVINVDDHTGILSIFGTEPSLADVSQGVMVGKIIDAAMQFNTLPDPLRVPVLFIALNIVGNEITDHNLFIITGQINMCKKIHFITLSLSKVRIEKIYLTCKPLISYLYTPMHPFRILFLMLFLGTGICSAQCLD